MRPLALVTLLMLAVIVMMAHSGTVQAATDAAAVDAAMAAAHAASVDPPRFTQLKLRQAMRSTTRGQAAARTGGGAGGGQTPPAPAPAPAPAPGPAPTTIQVSAVMKDPLTNMLESKWAVVFLVFILLIILCAVAYCFREHVGACIACCETVCYHTVKIVMLPLKLLAQLGRAIFYPFKQCVLACKDRTDRYFNPSEMRVSGLRY